jgi:DNA invertase Pin-like site-specific DNA recombinase
MKAFAYLRTSSATNVGQDKDSDTRQRLAIQAYAANAGIEIAGEFYDAAVSGADPILSRPGFADMLATIQGNGVRTIIVENASRFARDLIVQETGYAFLRDQGVTLIAADDPDAFTNDTPTGRLIRQILGAVSEFEKANLVAKLRGARERKRRTTGRCEGPKQAPDAARSLAQSLHSEGKSLRAISAALAEQGHHAPSGKPYGPESIKRMLPR